MLQTQGLSPHQLITPEGRRGLRAGAGAGGTGRDRVDSPMEVTREEQGTIWGGRLVGAGGQPVQVGAVGDSQGTRGAGWGHKGWLGDTGSR